MRIKEYYREMFHKWFGECSPEPEQGDSFYEGEDYAEDATDPENKPSEPLKKESEVNKPHIKESEV